MAPKLVDLDDPRPLSEQLMTTTGVVGRGHASLLTNVDTWHSKLASAHLVLDARDAVDLRHERGVDAEDEGHGRGRVVEEHRRKDRHEDVLPRSKTNRIK